MNEEACSKRECVQLDMFIVFSAVMLNVARLAVELNILALCYKLCGNNMLGVILGYLMMMFGKDIYMSKKIPDLVQFDTTNYNEIALKTVEFVPAVVLTLLAVMVILRIVAQYFS